MRLAFSVAAHLDPDILVVDGNPLDDLSLIADPDANFKVIMKDGKVQDDTRIVAAIPTITYVLEQGAKSVVLMSHLGDPKKDMKKAKEKAGNLFVAMAQQAMSADTAV